MYAEHTVWHSINYEHTHTSTLALKLKYDIGGSHYCKQRKRKRRTIPIKRQSKGVDHHQSHFKPLNRILRIAWAACKLRREDNIS